ncbi:hypothetical protein ACOYW6_01795 [Parablastomonas sp. CN1-191]|uniref:hypothetical protein n=1 Tax=Parablastomonas sp. CN1-191 TaxID=3400908 RepID=UPI003BF8916F
MADRDPMSGDEDQSPSTQIDEEKGRIKQPQQQDGAEKNLPRGSEAETHARK